MVHGQKGRGSVTRLTPAAARDAKPGTVLHDHEVKGLQLHTGTTSKSWRLYYRTRAGVERRPTIGHYPDMPLARARELARDLREQIARGEDPSGSWQASRAAATVAELCDKYLREWAPRHKSKRSVADDVGRINAYVIPGLGTRKVAEVTRADIDSFLEAICERKFAAQLEHPLWKDKTQSPGAANQVRRLLSKLWNLAQNDFAMDDRLRNPVQGSLHYTMRKRKRAATPAELAAIMAKIEALEERQPREAACLWVLLFTGARVGEVVDTKDDEWHGDKLVKTQHKTARHTGQERIIAIPQIALRILARLPIAIDSSGRLFSRQAVRTAWERMRVEIGCEDLQLRDFRRTFASYAASIGKTLNEIGQQLGHSSDQTTRGYSWIFEDAKVRTANEVAEHMMRVGKR